MTLNKFFHKRPHQILLAIIVILTVSNILLAIYNQQQSSRLNIQLKNLNTQISTLNTNKLKLSSNLATIGAELDSLKHQDQFMINKQLKDQIDNVHKNYDKAVSTYQNIQDLRAQNPKLDKKFDTLFAAALTQLSTQNYSSASSTLDNLNNLIKTEQDRYLASSQPTVANAPTSNSPPGSGYSRQKVHTDSGDFLIDIVSADLNSTKVIVDTASDATCTNNCPALALSDYVSRSGAFAGVNGSYFCPADYPSCSGKTNSFDTLLMNKNHVYFNSDNNIYSNVPAAIFGNGYARFVGRSLEWGRDTSVDAVIANHPLLTSGGNGAASDWGEAKLQIKSNRAFVGATGSTAYLGVVYNVTVFESAKVMLTLGVKDSLNLDSGGSTAFWFSGYKAGPGRNIPNAVLFVKR